MPVEEISDAVNVTSEPDASTHPQWMSSAQRIVRDVLELPREAREAIVIQLEASLDEFDPNVPALNEGEFREVWADELNRRWEDYESGRVRAIPYEEVMATLQSRYQP